MELATPLAELDWLTPPRVVQLGRLGLRTVGDLLTHFPKRYEDRTQFDRFPTGDSEEPVCVCGVVKKTTLRRIRGSQKMFDAILEEEQSHALSQPLICRWFNAHWVEKMIVQGHRIVVYGRPKSSSSGVVIAHPEFEIVADDAEESIHLRRIAPIHRATEGLPPRVIRRLVWDALARWPGDDAATGSQLPRALDATPQGWALRQIHFPESQEALVKARRHLVLAEFFAMQLSVAAQRAEQQALPGAVHGATDTLMQRLHAALPFPLTGAQDRAIAEIGADLASPRAMNRLLHGDVGSGKTLVALSAMLLAVEAGWQAALMAPTQILAEQHYLSLTRLCAPLGLRVALRTGSRREESGSLPLFAEAEARAPAEIAASESTSPAPGGTGGPPVVFGGPAETPARRAAPRVTTSGATYWRRALPHFERPWAKYAIHFNTLPPRHLNPAARDLVLDCILHWRDRRYALYAACVMPDHVHLLLEPGIKATAEDGTAEFYSLTEILHTLKSFTAHGINKAEGRHGPLWQEERFDRYLRSEADLAEKFGYICGNPWAAGIVSDREDYPWVWYPERALQPGFSGSGAEAGAKPPDAEAGRLGGRASGPFHPADSAVDSHTPEEGVLSADRAGSSLRRDAVTNAQDERAPQTSGAAAPPFPSTEPHLVVGTHALLYEGAGFTRLGLAVIDEQHKFGVLQRAKLRAQGAAPDVLVMTATPIPRTLTMTLYGDLDVSTLDEMPKNRGRIVTGVRPAAKLPDAAKFLREHLEAGRQAYIVYPLIDESEKLESKAAAAEFSKWQELLAPMPCALLHGRIPPEEKEAIMDRFRRGETKALIATTVIEVGIDVPNANLMLIENAERFGLAQLHQLRGRIGRGEHKSYCILLHGPKLDEEAKLKLATLERTANGFEIAEADFQMRGPGNMLGTAQSGLDDFKLGDIRRDGELMRLARNAAFLVFERDPQLERPEHQGYRAVLDARRKLRLAHVS